MAGPIKNISETLLIPEGSRERFLFFGPPPGDEHYRTQRLIGGISDLAPGYRVRRRAFGSHELLFPLEGLLTVEIGGKEVEAAPGEGVFLAAKDAHNYGSEAALRLLWFHFDPELFADAPPGRSRRSPAFRLPETRLLAELLYLEERRDPGRAAATGNALRHYLELQLGAESPEERLAARLDPVFEKVRARVERNWSVAEMARLGCMSESYFFAAVRKLYATTPLELLRRMRLETAAALLLRSNCELKTVAARTGYADAFSFSRAFRRHYRMSPSAFRRAAEAGNPG